MADLSVNLLEDQLLLYHLETDGDDLIEADNPDEQIVWDQDFDGYDSSDPRISVKKYFEMIGYDTVIRLSGSVANYYDFSVYLKQYKDSPEKFAPFLLDDSLPLSLKSKKSSRLQGWIASLKKEILTLKDKIRRRYGIQIQTFKKDVCLFTGDGDTWFLKDALENEVVQLRALKKQLIKVPSKLLRSLGIKKFVLCGGIKRKRDGQFQDFMGAFSHRERGIIYLSGGISITLWHEVWHFMDLIYGDERNFFLQGMDEPLNDQWCGLEPDGNLHPDEEQAFYASYLFNSDNPRKQKVIQQPKFMSDLGRSESQAKLALMKQWLDSYSKGKFNDQYWADLASGRVDENYWK